ncbi:glycosyltransferase family 4 protein [Polaribacter sargassicola]|uniref:glycosyltransferase family 4 protein n=1 Tax=Polaribacter sargassicola TaxID=2836891 RepID=UPI001F3C4BD2|nr:glycosyltransferase [Polaribacter sp. DS7-9]MCG1037810.1 glycosyltransferase [Polaribacter sp. DS7-9]
MKIAYFTNIELKEQSGGASGLNVAIFNQLKKRFEVSLMPVIYPKSDFPTKIISKGKRILGLRGEYHFFSDDRLSKVSSTFNTISVKQKSNKCFFFGFTQWIKTKPQEPYYSFNDACFATYVNVYNDKEDFLEKDLERIFTLESNWLKNAKKVFFTSQWALEETKNYYKTNGENFINVGVGGFIDIPKKDNYKEGYNFLFISREFIPKGGVTVVDALILVRKKYPEAKLWIVGEKPSDEILSNEGVIYKGFFDKSNPEEEKELNTIFQESFAIVHPTLKDTTTLVINELAYFGCPAISSNKFAIPEYLIDGKSGYLLDNPRDENELASKMILMMQDKSSYFKMREFTRENSVNNNTWDKVGERMIKSIEY